MLHYICLHTGRQQITTISMTGTTTGQKEKGQLRIYYTYSIYNNNIIADQTEKEVSARIKQKNRLQHPISAIYTDGRISRHAGELLEDTPRKSIAANCDNRHK